MDRRVKHVIAQVVYLVVLSLGWIGIVYGLAKFVGQAEAAAANPPTDKVEFTRLYVAGRGEYTVLIKESDGAFITKGLAEFRGEPIRVFTDVPNADPMYAITYVVTGSNSTHAKEVHVHAVSDLYPKP